MPSPFPGMDPYLEGPLWTTVPYQLCAEIARQLVPKIRPRYLAFANERVVVIEPDSGSVATSSIFPDIGVSTNTSAHSKSGTTLAPAPQRLATVMPESIPHITVEIRDTEKRQLVTVIEVLSPTNKSCEGRQEYLRKRNRILFSSVHLLEIDFLRTGLRVPMQRDLPEGEYFVFLGRADQRPWMEVFAISLKSPLPSIPVPLLHGDSDVFLDLHLAFTNIYDEVGFDLAVDYSQPPKLPLPSELAAWSDDLLMQYQSPSRPS